LLKKHDIKIDTVDIDEELKPDYVASVLDLPFNDNKYDVVVAFQVLEHIPFDKFSQAISEMRRVGIRYLIISLPDAKKWWEYAFYIPFLGQKRFLIKRPRIRPRIHQFDGEHHWEISKKGFSLEKIKLEFKEQNLELVKTYFVPENFYHRFFVLKIK